MIYPWGWEESVPWQWFDLHLIAAILSSEIQTRSSWGRAHQTPLARDARQRHAEAANYLLCEMTSSHMANHGNSGACTTWNMFFLAKIWTFTINWSCSWKYREPVACWQSRICPPEPRFCPCNQGNKLWNKVCSLVVGNMFTLLSSRKGWRGPEHWTCPGLRSWRRWLACKTMCSPWEFLHHGLRKEAQDSKESIGTPWVSDWRLFKVLSLNLAPSPWGSHTWSE